MFLRRLDTNYLELKVQDELREKLKEIDIPRLTPLEALNILQF
jgi:hypothetical protein